MPILRPGDPLFERLRFPRPGTRLTFQRNPDFWFTNYVEDADRLLVEGQHYTLSDIEVYSSWAKVTLVEVPDAGFPLSFFAYERPPAPPRNIPPAEPPTSDPVA
jgi:hypothetical protein